MSEEVGTTPPVQPNSAKPKRPRKLYVALTLGPIVAMTIGANIASAFFPALVKDHPLILIAFDPRWRNMLLATAEVAFWSWFVIGMIRRTVFHPLYFLLGRWYGEAAVRWIEKKSPDMGSLIISVEKWFPRYGPFIVAIYGHGLVCVLAGASKMRMLPFVIYGLIGNIIQLTIYWKIGDVAKVPIEATTGFIGRYSLPLTIASIALVVFYSARNQKSGKSTLETPSQLEAELNEESKKIDD